MTRRRRSKSKKQAKKIFLYRNRGFKFRLHRRTLLEECVGRIAFLSFNLQQIPNISELACYYIEFQ
jgi:hypothetical protein